MSNLKNMSISRYDESIKQPPYRTIQIDSITVDKPEFDQYGESFYDNIKRACQAKGYLTKFYSLSENPEFDYDVVVD